MPEIVVVGGGVIGASAGYSLARAGASVENIRKVARIIPSFESARLIETRVGFRPFTKDRIPHIRWASSIGGLLLGLGISSQGMTMGAHTGAALADLALAVPGREIPASFKPRV